MAVQAFGDTNLHIGDIVVIAAYFGHHVKTEEVLVATFWPGEICTGYQPLHFTASSAPWEACNAATSQVGASLFASNIGSLHFVGLAGSGAAAGISIGIYELNAIYIVIMLGYLFLPVYIASGVYTMPQYLQRRFGGVRIQIYLAVLTLLVYIFTKISADLFSGVIFIEQALNWDMYGAICLLLGVAAIFTITGGLTAVIWTDFIQTIIMLVGATILMIISFDKVGGFNGMVEKYPHAIPNSTLYSNDTCGIPRGDYMHLFRDPINSDLPWPGILGLCINSVWYWCSDQVIVQRALAGKNFTHAKAGTLLCGYLKILPLFLLVFPGMIARILFTETVGCADPDICQEVCGSSTGCTNIAYPTLVINLLPAGARGMMLAVMLAALMSSLTSIFNSSSTVFAMDVWIHFRKKASELEIMIVGRVFVIVLVVISIIWIPVIKASQGSELFIYIQEVSSFLQPPLCAVFLLGIFWPRLNEKGAFTAAIIGLLTGIIRFALQYSYKTPECGSDEEDPTPSLVKDFHYLYFSVFLFLFTGTIAVVVSLITKPIDPRCLERLTWQSRHSTKPRLDINDWLEGRTVDAEKAVIDGAVNPSVEDKDTSCAKAIDADDEDEAYSDSDPSNIPRRVFNWICGIDAASKTQLSSHQVVVTDMLSIDETPRYKTVTALMASVLAAVGCFLLGFFA